MILICRPGSIHCVYWHGEYTAVQSSYFSLFHSQLVISFDFLAWSVVFPIVVGPVPPYFVFYALTVSGRLFISVQNFKWWMRILIGILMLFSFIRMSKNFSQEHGKISQDLYIFNIAKNDKLSWTLKRGPACRYTTINNGWRGWVKVLSVNKVI